MWQTLGSRLRPPRTVRGVHLLYGVELVQGVLFVVALLTGSTTLLYALTAVAMIIFFVIMTRDARIQLLETGLTCLRCWSATSP